ncbi:hypothetical protein JCM5353_007251 [Sporobolomyces roseus]
MRNAGVCSDSRLREIRNLGSSFRPPPQLDPDTPALALSHYEDEGGRELSGVSQLAQPPTSLLDLPDDILHLILKEVHEERQTVITTNNSLPVAEVLINKRIFSLARPLWFKHLSISTNQLDRRLSGLHVQDERRLALRQLSIAFAESHLYLFVSVLSRLPHLTYLAIQVPDNLSPQASAEAMVGVASLAALEHLKLQFADSVEKSVRMWSDYHKAEPDCTPRISLESKGVPYYDLAYMPGTDLRWLKTRKLTVKKLSSSDWPRLLSLELTLGPGNLLSWNDQILKNLQEAVANDDMLLERLKIPLRFPVDLSGIAGRVFTATDYKRLLELLQRTKLRHLELACLQQIPDTPYNLQIESLQLLRLSGSCTFKDSTSFRNLFALLSALPSLTQLHLVGSSFFGPTSTAHEMSSHSEMSLFFDYPELSAILTYLRRSNTTIFTYRGQDEKREMRWTRLNKEEEFERDCWTL